jgi:hypothetical protein
MPLYRKHPAHDIPRTDAVFLFSLVLQLLQCYGETKVTKFKNRLKKDLCEDLINLGLTTRGETLRET